MLLVILCAFGAVSAVHGSLVEPVTTVDTVTDVDADDIERLLKSPEPVDQLLSDEHIAERVKMLPLHSKTWLAILLYLSDKDRETQLRRTGQWDKNSRAKSWKSFEHNANNREMQWYKNSFIGTRGRR